MSASSTLRSYNTSLSAYSNDSSTMGLKFDNQLNTLSSTVGNSISETLTEASITSSESSEQIKSNQSQMFLDEEGKIGPYVDFTSFYEAVRKAKEEGTIPEDAIY
jgi:hypothetical protein